MAVFLLQSGCSTNDLDGTDSIATSNYANRTLQYYYYIPGNLKSQRVPFLICVPGLSGNGQDFVFDDVKRFARKNGVAVVAPSFRYDEMKWQNRTSYQFPEAWSGNALLAILDQFSQKHDLQSSGLYLLGASAGAQFCLRFSLWQPERCIACAAYAAGGSIEPSRNVDVRYMIGIGSKDTTRIYFSETFRDVARRNGIDVEYNVYDSDHSMPDQFITDALGIFGELGK